MSLRFRNPLTACSNQMVRPMDAGVEMRLAMRAAGLCSIHRTPGLPHLIMTLVILCKSKSQRGSLCPNLGRRGDPTRIDGSKRIRSTFPPTGRERGQQSPEIEVTVILRATRTEAQRCGTPSVPGWVPPAARAPTATAPRPAAARTPARSALFKHRRPHALWDQAHQA